ncbi:hypothetical protein ACOMHN_034049 [Nucella lapillus]
MISNRTPKYFIAVDPSRRSVYSSVQLLARMRATDVSRCLSFGVVSVMARCGVAVADRMYEALVVFVLPLSCALNPLQYMCTFSSLKRKQAQDERLLLGSSSQPGTLDLSSTASDTSNTADRSGRCDLTMSIPVTSGTYFCSVTVNPGNTKTSCGSFTIRGPDTVSIDENTPFYTDTAGSKVMTLTCWANEVNPSSALTYSWNVLCYDKQQSTCTFKPRPGPNGDDNTVITCTVTNSKNSIKQRQKSVTLDIKYPPPSAPKISGYINGHILYQGDNLTLTCAVTGGDPQVTSVTLACPGRSMQKTTNGQSSSLEFSTLSSSDHNLTCVSSGQWARESYYTLTDSRTLTVYCGDSRPALEGKTVTLTCSLNFSGYPSAEVTWTSETPVVKNSSLSLGKKYHLSGQQCLHREQRTTTDLYLHSTCVLTDSGVYQVEGRTTNPANDGRLPRTAHSNLTVLVKSSDIHCDEQ